MWNKLSWHRGSFHSDLSFLLLSCGKGENSHIPLLNSLPSGEEILLHIGHALKGCNARDSVPIVSEVMKIFFRGKSPPSHEPAVHQSFEFFFFSQKHPLSANQ